MWPEWSDRSAYRELRFGMTGAEVDAVFARSSDCVFKVGDFEARYYLNRGYEPSRMGPNHGCTAGREATATWSSLPGRMYCAAFVVLGPDGRVQAYKLLGESFHLERAAWATVPQTFDGPPCC
jgi:hypothetical protein